MSYATADLPEHYFPFTVEFLHPTTGEVLHTAYVEGPGVLDVPSASSLGVAEVEVRITTADGKTGATNE